MNNNIQLSIPKPCSQNWEGMSVNETGRFCGSCNKSVIDFTRYTDQQLINFLNKSSGEVCGKLKPDQLSKPLHSKHQSNKRSIPQLLLSAALVVGLGNNVYAKEKQGEVRIIQAPTNEKKAEQKKNSQTSSDSTHCIKGTVTDKRTKETIPGATILLEGSTIATATDMNGYFKLDVSDFLQMDTIKLIISSLGYENQTLKFTARNLISNSTIELIADTTLTPIIMGGISFQKPSLWQRVRYFFRSKFNN
jgi:hypothetical protein